MTYKNFIDNEWQDAISGKKFGVFNPFTEELIAEVPASDENDLDIVPSSSSEGSSNELGHAAGGNTNEHVLSCWFLSCYRPRSVLVVVLNFFFILEECVSSSGHYCLYESGRCAECGDHLCCL